MDLVFKLHCLGPISEMRLGREKWKGSREEKMWTKKRKNKMKRTKLCSPQNRDLEGSTFGASPWTGLSVGRLVDWSVCHNFQKGRKLRLHASFRNNCLIWMFPFLLMVSFDKRRSWGDKGGRGVTRDGRARMVLFSVRDDPEGNARRYWEKWIRVKRRIKGMAELEY